MFVLHLNRDMRCLTLALVLLSFNVLTYFYVLFIHNTLPTNYIVNLALTCIMEIVSLIFLYFLIRLQCRVSFWTFDFMAQLQIQNITNRWASDFYALDVTIYICIHPGPPIDPPLL